MCNSQWKTTERKKANEFMQELPPLHDLYESGCVKVQASGYKTFIMLNPAEQEIYPVDLY